MNLYILMEGKRSEAIIYPSWLSCLERPFSRFGHVEQVVGASGRNFFPFSANGYPSIIGGHLRNAIEDVRRFPGYDWLLVCLDVDEATADERILEVEQAARAAGIDELPVRLFVVPQARTIESWLLGNPRLIGSAPPPYVAELRDFYDVRSECPEAMGHPRSWGNHAQFHFHYLREAFKAKHMRYSKTHPGDAASGSYFDAIRSRSARDADALPTFKRFLRFIESV